MHSAKIRSPLGSPSSWFAKKGIDYIRVHAIRLRQLGFL